MEKSIFLIGTGPHAIDYAKVLKAQNVSFTVIGRGEVSAANFEEATGIKAVTGGVEKYIRNSGFSGNAYVILATGTEALMPALLMVLKAGVEKVLVEKPAAISIGELLANEENLKPYGDKVLVAYNRRFYASVVEAKRLIEEDGGLQSMHFEFTEWAHKIEPLHKADGVKENWFFANSTHVVDLAFFLAGNPAEWQAYSRSGKLTWHEKTNFAGAGITENGVLFSYISNWESAGRWAIELLTGKRRIYLKPLETIGIQMKGSIPVIAHIFDDSLDKNFKPGLYNQVDDFLNSIQKNSNATISDHIFKAKTIYAKIIS